jgi:tRNA(adenine34) deaminase
MFAMNPQDDSLDIQWMNAAICQAMLAERAGEVPVGAVVVDPYGKPVGQGQNRVIRENDPTAHAEVVALRAAGQALKNYRLEHCRIYVTLEPCAMCAGAMIHARIAHLIFGALDPKAGAAGSVLQVLNHPGLNHRMQVTGNVLGEECGSLLRKFFQARR